MELVPIDLVGLVATIMGISVVLVPVIGLTARFALKPTVEALGRFFEHHGLEESVRIMERRLGLMEQQIEAMEESVRRVTDATEFHAALDAPRPEGGGATGEPPPGQDPGGSR